MEPTKTYNISDHSTDRDRVLIIREGRAPDVKPLKSVKLEGALSAPFEFLIGGRINEQEAIHLEIFKDKGILVLVIDDTHPDTTHVITGKLAEDSFLKDFHINDDSVRVMPRELVKFLRKNRFFFPDKGEFDKLLVSLQHWNITVEKVIEDHNNDRTGNSKFSLEAKVSNISLLPSFSLEVPIYKGYPKQKFRVEIGVDTSATTASLYLYSDELIETQHIFREKIMADELAKFSDYTFSKVNIS